MTGGVAGMDCIIGRFRIDNIDAWKQVIESDQAAHRQAGLRFKHVWKNMDDPVEIFFLFECEDLQKAKMFLEKAGALDDEKQNKGEIPTLFLLKSA